MELTLSQALRLGIEAQEAGKLKDADRYYTAILKVDPKHPDANHNMGVIAVGVEKYDAALPFFETAIETNPNIDQFWLSYIDALIKIGRVHDAKVAFDEAKRTEAKGDGFNRIEERLSAIMLNSPPIQKSLQDELLELLKLYNQNKLEQVYESSRNLSKIYPNNLTLWNLIGASAAQIGNLEVAIHAFQQTICIKPDYAEGFHNLGLALKQKGKFNEAILAYKNALSIKSDYADAYYNMGIAHHDQGNIDEALAAYNKALTINPDYANIYFNKGVALQEQKKFNEAVVAYDKAVSIKPDFVEALNNYGNVLQRQGKLNEAVEVYNKAISFKSDYADAYCNMGTALHDLGRIEEAKKTYYKALSVKGDYAEVYWNLFGTSENINEAKKWITKCLEANPKYIKAKMTMAALKFYEGERTALDELKGSTLADHPFTRSFAWAFSLPKLPPLHFHRWALFDHMIALSKKERPFYEFGVWRGEAFKYLIKTFKKGYGFDTFEGIPTDWHDEKAGTYSSEGSVPEIKGGEFIVGNFEESLPKFFEVPRPMASLINFDADLYSSTIVALNYAKPVIDKHTILIFDEFIINENWEKDEYKALEEFCYTNNYRYEVLAMCFYSKQVAVKIIGI